MEIIFPYQVEYTVKETVSVEEVIETLQANKRLMSDVAGILPVLLDGVKVERIELRVRDIRHGSLREVFWVAIFLAFQKQLEDEVPAVVEKWFGLPVSDDYDTLVTICVLLLTYYGADYAYKRFMHADGSEKLARAINDLADEIAEASGRTSEEVKQVFQDYLGKRGRLKELAKAAVRFFRPSLNQKHDDVVVGDRRVIRDLIREIPNVTNVEDITDDDFNMPMDGVRVQIRAKDHDHEGSGWGGIVEAVTSRRRPLKLDPSVPKDYLWEHDEVWADISITYRPDGAAMKPIRYHIRNVYDQYPKPGVMPLDSSSGNQSPEDTES